MTPIDVFYLLAQMATRRFQGDEPLKTAYAAAQILPDMPLNDDGTFAHCFVIERDPDLTAFRDIPGDHFVVPDLNGNWVCVFDNDTSMIYARMQASTAEVTPKLRYNDGLAA